MELSHEFTVPAGVDAAWATFMDLQRVGGCFPGATITDVSENAFSGTVKVKLGPIALVYAGSGEFVERDDATHRAVIEAKGKDKRGNGTAGATVTIQLAPDGDGTRVDVSTDLNVTGKPAQFGRGVMQDVSDKLLQQFVGCVERQFAAPEEESEPVAPDGAAAGSAAVASVAESAPASAAAGDGDGTASNASNGTPPVADTGARPATTARPQPAPRHAPPPASDDAIDLGATVLPVMLRTYGPYAAAGLVGILLGILIGRRGSSS